MRRREIDGLSVDENVVDVTNNNVMSTDKFYLADKVKIASSVKVDQDGKEITSEERDMEFVVTQTYSDDKNMYFISKEDFKHKLSAKELVKVVK